ncbi:ankyrin repeat-containing domain protein [Echria macrotheca]|uniref:Ankyrin repeat-containing domain protein n=1 Tax=Echria macrotheca TaxID=438768 RepID=A0AAJ0FAD7_9PEZI|nr:ankyrin repeat-containing domain protein [Echria macrotheca]
MDAVVVGGLPPAPAPQQSVPLHSAPATSATPGLTDGVIEAWKARCAALGQDERDKFESFACDGLASYMDMLAKTCQEHRTESRAFRFLDWFEPLFTAVDLFMPAATVAIQAYPNPGSLILGGIVAALDATNRLRDYHRLTVQLLARMGRKASVLQEYETVVYKSDEQVQKALIDVYGDILEFCQKAVKFVTKNNKKIIRVKGFKMMLFRDFEAQLGSLAQAFHAHLDHLETLGALCDKKRLKDLHDELVASRDKRASEASEGHKEQLQRLNATMDQLLKREKDRQIQEEQRRKEQRRKSLLDWLSAMNFLAPYDRRCEEHLEGTGSWLLNSKAYTEWKTSEKSDLLWVRGKPGCGKSVLAAVTITDLKLEVEPDTALGYAFCRRDEESFQDPTGIFGALARQISEHTPTLDPVLDMESRAYSSASPSRTAIRLIISSAIKAFKRVYLVVDALDECRDNDQLAKELRDLVENKGLPPVKVIVFSRNEYKIEQHLGEYKQIEPDQGANEEDLKAYIQSRFPNDKKADGKKSANAEIREQCFLKADGMFLWVQLLADTLHNSPLPKKEKLRLIKTIPPGLDSMYDRILEGICNQVEYSRTTAFSVLLWVMYAWRPMTRTEMLDAVADYSEATKLEDATRHEKAEHLVSICANLVFIDKEGSFRLCHESVRSHLEKLAPEPNHPLSEFLKRKENIHQRLAEICLNYLLLEDFERGAALSWSGLYKFAERKPFLSYASNWDVHVNKENASALHDLIMKCVNSQPRRELSMQFNLLDLDSLGTMGISSSNLWKYSGTSNPLHLLAICGLKSVAEKLPDVASMALEEDGSERTPLAYVVARQHQEMALWLIEQIQSSPDHSLSVAQQLSVLHSAAELGWADIVEKLLSRNEDLVNLKMSPDGQTPLGRAAMAGKKEVVEVLLRHDANVNLADGKADYPLLLAASCGHTSVVHLLLAHGAEPNCCDAQGFGPLHYAADIANTEIATALLEENADPLSTGPEQKNKSPLALAALRDSVEMLTAFRNAQPDIMINMKTERGWNPIHGAAFHNAAKALKYLAEMGNQKDSLTDDAEKETALNIAADLGHLESVKVLIDVGCDPTLRDAKGKNALHSAARSGKIKVVQYILDKHAAAKSLLLSQEADAYETPLHSAVYGENPDIVKLLLEHGSDPCPGNDAKSSPLHWAAEKGLTKIAAILLTHSKDANPRDSSSQTPIHLAAKSGKYDFIVQFLQDAASLGLSVDINAVSKAGKSAIGLSLLNGFDDIAMFLLEHGATSLVDEEGNYPIHHAAWRGYDAVVEKLMTQAGVDKRGYFGRTPLHCASLRGHLSTVKLLFPASTNVVEDKDERGNTAIDSALIYHHLDVANYLLDMGADHTGVDEFGNSLLQIAAGVPDLPMVERLLGLGCPGDQQNKLGGTPFSTAVQAGSTEVVDALIAAGYNGLHINDLGGNSPAVTAVEQGRLKMLRKLDDLGAPWHSVNNLGRNAAHAAVAKCHPSVLQFLEAKGVDFGLVDGAGYTPLMMAAWEGNAAAVSYLLQTQAHTVNYSTPLTRHTALGVAAQQGFPQCIRLLLAAGADPHYRDLLGRSAIEYASLHRPSLREMHKAQYFHGSEDPELRRRSWINIICQLSHLLLDEPTDDDLYTKINRTWQLSSALFSVGDSDAAKIPMIEVLWPPKFGLAELGFSCCICRTEKFQGDKYICQNCFDWTTMCATCYVEFETAKGNTPPSLKEVQELEKQLLPVRLAVLEETSLLEVVKATRHFIAGCNFTKETMEKYELWEQKHNSNSRFHKIIRPGQEFIKIVMDAAKFSEGAFNHDAVELLKGATQLVERYEEYHRQHGFIKDLPEFWCENHKYMLITDEEANKVKNSAADLGFSGPVTPDFLRGLLEKYENDVDTASLSENPAGLYREDSSASISSKHTSWAGKGPEGYRAGFPQRSFTVAVRQPVPKHPAELERVPSKTDIDFTPSSQISQMDSEIRPLRRAQTLPANMDADFSHLFPRSSQTPNLAPKDAARKLEDVSSAQELRDIAESHLNDGPNSFGPTSPEESGDAPVEALSEEPAEVALTRTASRFTIPPDISAANKTSNEESILRMYMRLILADLAHDSFPNIFGKVDVAYALHATEAMIPGFAETYFAAQQDDYVLSREEAREASPSSHESGDESEDDDSATAVSSDEDDE